MELDERNSEVLMPDFSRHQRALLLLAVGLAVTYLLVPFQDGSVLNIFQKSSACILLACLAFWAIEDRKIKKIALAALLFSSLGDAFLAIRSSDYFTHGLGSFLIAHLLYILIFVRARNWQPLPVGKQIAIAAIILLSIGMLVMLWPALGALKAPVFVYVTVIAMMAVSAIYAAYPAALVVIGALSFLVSDSTIAINKFLMPFSLSGPLIWITYILAQVLLTLAIIKGPNNKNAS